MNRWFALRIALVVTAFVQALLSGRTPIPDENISFPWLLGLLLFGIFGMLFVVGIQRINPRTAKRWRYPSWSANPFQLREPLQFFHMGGSFFLASGVGVFLSQVLAGKPITASSLMFLAIGAGVLCGVRACTWVYRGKMLDA
jgi:hypothetical protein